MDNAQKALFAIMEERTSGAMERMSDTYHGATNNLKDSVTKLQAALGEELLPILTDLIRELTKFIDFLNNLGSGFTGVISQALLFTTAIAGVSSGIIGAGLKLQSFVAQLQAAGAAAATSGTSFTSLSVSLAGMVPIVGALAIAFGTLANAYITNWRKMEEEKAEQIVGESQKIAEALTTIKEKIDIINDTPIEIASKTSKEELEKVKEGLQELIDNILELRAQELDDEGKGFEVSFTSTENPMDRFGQVSASMQTQYEKAGEYVKSYSEALKSLPEDINRFEAELKKLDAEQERNGELTEAQREEYAMWERSISQANELLEKAKNEIRESSEITDRVIAKKEEEIEKTKDASKVYTQLTAKLQEQVKVYEGSVPAINEAKESLTKYLDEIEQRTDNKEKLLYISSVVDKELAAGKDLEQIYQDLGVTAEELEALLAESSETSKDTVEDQIDNLNQLVQAEEKTLDEKRKILSDMLQDETLTAEAREKIYDEIEKTEKDRWKNFEETQKTALAKGEITEKQYWEKVKEYLDGNENELSDSQEFKTQLTREYYEGIEKLRDKDVKDEQKALKEKEKAFKDHIQNLADLQEIGELSPEERKKKLQEMLKDEEITEEQRIAIKKEVVSTEKDIAKEKEKLEKEEQERTKATYQLKIETLEAEGQIWEAKKLKIEAEVEAKKQAGLDEVEIERWKNAQIKTVEEERIQQSQQIEQEILGLQKSSIEEQIDLVNNRAEAMIAQGASRLQAEVSAHAQIMQLEQEQTKIIQEEYKKRVEQIHQQAEEYKKSGADIVDVEKFVSESVENLQVEVFNDFLERENQKRAEIQETHDLIQSLEEQLAENLAKQQALLSGSSTGSSPLMSMEEAFASDYKSPYVQRMEELQELKEEEKSLREQQTEAFEKEREQQEELKQIQEQKKTVQEALNEELGKTTSQYDAIKQASPWSSETAAVQQYTTAINEALAAMQNLNAEGGDVGSSGGESGSGSGSGGSGGTQFDPDDYSGKTEGINNQTQGETQDSQSQSEQNSSTNDALIDAILYYGGGLNMQGTDEAEGHYNDWTQDMQEYGEQYGYQDEAATAVQDYSTGDTTVYPPASKGETTINNVTNNTYNVNGSEVGASSGMTLGLDVIQTELLAGTSS